MPLISESEWKENAIMEDVARDVVRSWYISIQIRKEVEDIHVGSVITLHGYHIRALMGETGNTRL